MNPYDPPQAVDDDTLDVEMIQTEGNFRVFAAGVSMVVVGAALILFRHLAQSFAGGGQSSPVEQDWLYWFVGFGVLLVLFRRQKRRRRIGCKTLIPNKNSEGRAATTSAN